MMAQTYGEWRDTCIALHMTTQMMGKVKLEMAAPQPEWSQVVLDVFPTGFTTGYLAHGSGGLQIDLDVMDAQVRALNTEGAAAAFPLRECLSVSDCYDRFVNLLENVGHPCPIYPVPQEMFTDEPFYHLDEPLAFDDQRAQAYFDQCLFARDALLEFSAPWRGKKTPPSLYWGTFDMTCVLFSGEPCPFDPEASLVERVALDEQLVEFGFWPGDETYDKAAFFVMAYPFLENSAGEVPVDGACFDASRAQYLLPLEDVLRARNPHAAVVRFCREAFARIAEQQRWNHLAWLTKPLITQ